MAAGKILYHVDKNGKNIFALTLEQDILSPPAVNEAGDIFIATESKLIRVD